MQQVESETEAVLETPALLGPYYAPLQRPTAYYSVALHVTCHDYPRVNKTLQKHHPPCRSCSCWQSPRTVQVSPRQSQDAVNTRAAGLAASASLALAESIDETPRLLLPIASCPTARREIGSRHASRSQANGRTAWRVPSRSSMSAMSSVGDVQVCHEQPTVRGHQSLHPVRIFAPVKRFLEV